MSGVYRVTIKIIFVLICFFENSSMVTAFNRGRIVNGSIVREGEFPFMLSVRRIPSGRHFCGATIVNQFWALTAAHCVSGTFPSRINVQFGSVELDANSKNVVNVSKIYVHEGYLPQNQYIHDIALLKLKSPLNLGTRVKPIRLPKMQQLTPANKEAVLIGWGYNATGGSIQTQLHKVRLETYSDDECSRLHETDMHETALCAGVKEGGRGQCNGDSGGPLIVNGQQVGIVSWSRKPCAIAPFPGVFTEVSAYMDWILKTTSDERELEESNNIEDSSESIFNSNLKIRRKLEPLPYVKKKN